MLLRRSYPWRRVGDIHLGLLHDDVKRIRYCPLPVTGAGSVKGVSQSWGRDIAIVIMKTNSLSSGRIREIEIVTKRRCALV